MTIGISMKRKTKRDAGVEADPGNKREAKGRRSGDEESGIRSPNELPGITPSADTWRRYLVEALTGLPMKMGRLDPLETDTPETRKAQVADHVFKMLVRDPKGRPLGVALCSNPVSPGLVARGMRLAREAKNTLGPELGAAILDPLFEGEFNGLSCAVLPHCHPLSKWRLLNRYQLHLLRPGLFHWLRQVTERTVNVPDPASVESEIAVPLANLARHEELPDRLRDGASAALARLDEKTWSPRQVLAHNDLWPGNVLIDYRNITNRGDRRWRERFVIIDWPTASTRGYPIFDLMRLSMYFNYSDRHLRSELECHCGLLNCELPEAESYLLAALAGLLHNLEHFPLPLYRRMAMMCINRLEQITE